jgi:predicted NBD/HSP70 family sugar kinase
VARAVDDYALLVALVSEQRQVSRADLARLAGLSRSTVSLRVDEILKTGLIRESGNGPSTGGRKPVVLTINPEVGVVLGVDLGATHCHVAAADLAGDTLAIHSGAVDIGEGPVAVLNEVLRHCAGVLEACGRTTSDVLAVGVGIPGPVEFSTGTVVRPPIMPGWDDFVVSEYIGRLFDAPVVVDNDVNVMALGEYVERGQRDTSLLFIKIGTGIGCGIVSYGELHRGLDGAAGDIGHTRLPDHDDTVCACGNTGCLEAVASGAAIARQLRAEGRDVQLTSDVVRLAQSGDRDVMYRVRRAGEHIGSVLATLVNFYNPETIIIGGSLAALNDDLLAPIRGVVYQRATTLATRRFRLEITTLGWQAGVLGAVELARRAALSPDAVGRRLVPAQTEI